MGVKVSTAGLKGVNASGHAGWIEVKCRICALKMDVTTDPVYVCPACMEKYEAYFCPADARRLHHRCPFCGRELVPYMQALELLQQSSRR
ncbi:MAG TPA: hypothetical protein EYH08_03350 [Pyrodictium sp.]|nr:hypothetical protein [Pyrodictium sp.]